MAAPSNTVWGNTIGGASGHSSSYGKIGISATVTTTNTQVTVKIQTWFWSKYSVKDTNNSYYYNAASSATSLVGSKSINHTVASGSGWSTSNQTKLGESTYTYNRGTSAQTKYYAAKFTGIDILSGTMTVSTSVTVPALASYTVKYNANGGTGAPSNQTKWYGKILALSTTKPTRTGYTFQGWSTANDSSVEYASGANYTANAAVTLYAVWKINTFTVSYNANGGSGAPSNQTKNYGDTLTLSKTKPTRTGYTFHHWNTKADGTGSNYIAGAYYSSNSSITLYAIWTINTYTISYNANGGSAAPSSQTKNYGATLTLSSVKPNKPNYNFLGWSTSASATSPEYIAGGPFVANANTTLYAVWELAYYKPKIKIATASRCGNDGVTSSDGTYAYIYVEWDSFETVTSVVVQWKQPSDYTYSNSASATVNGNKAEIIVGNGSLATDTSYEFKITTTDTDSSIAYVTIPGSVFPIDTLAGGTGVAFGKKANKPYVADFAWAIYPRAGFSYPTLPTGTDLNTVTTFNTYSGDIISGSGYVNCPDGASGSITLDVLPAGMGDRIMQRLTVCSDPPSMYIRHRIETWRNWYKVY